MRSLQLWEPLFEDFWSFPDLFNRRLGTRGWTPAVDISEDKENVRIAVELPGLKKKDVKISMDDGVLTLQGERKFEREEKKEDYHRVERAYGSFSRSFTLPSNVDASKIQATMEEGILTIAIPKKEEAKPKEIEIH